MELGCQRFCSKDKRALVAAYLLGTRIGEFVRLPYYSKKKVCTIWGTAGKVARRQCCAQAVSVSALCGLGAGIGREEPQVLASGACQLVHDGAAGDGGRDALDLRERRGIVPGCRIRYGYRCGSPQPG